MQAKVSLRNLRFYAFHGLYPEEQKAGNWFTVNMDVYFELHDASDVSNTVDYTHLFEITKNKMAKPEGLMESVAQKIMEEVKEVFPIIQKTVIAISKEKPPISTIVGHTAIELTETYN